MNIFKTEKYKYEQIFTVMGSKGESLTKGSLQDCKDFIKAQEQTGEMLKEGQYIGSVEIDGKKYNAIIPTEQVIEVEVKKDYVSLFVGIGVICFGYFLFKRKKGKN